MIVGRRPTVSSPAASTAALRGRQEGHTRRTALGSAPRIDGRAGRRRGQPTACCSCVMALSGFTALAYEVVWTRGLVFHVGTTTHAFTSMLPVYLLGLAAGSFISAHWIERRRAHAPRALAILQLAIGASGAVSLVRARSRGASPRRACAAGRVLARRS